MEKSTSCPIASRSLQKDGYFHCQHVYREENGMADLLAKWSHKMDIIQQFYSSQQLRGAIKGSYILEKMGMQLFRRRKLKRIKHPP